LLSLFCFNALKYKSKTPLKSFLALIIKLLFFGWLLINLTTFAAVLALLFVLF
jgi:hypothetical protein